MKKTILPLKVVFAVVLCFAAGGVAAVELDFSDDLTNPDRLDGSTTASWSEAVIWWDNDSNPKSGAYSLVAGNSLNDPLSHGAVTSIGGGSDNSAAAVMGDVNDDGELDLIVANRGAVNKVYLNKNDGSGDFDAGVDVGAETDVSTSLALGDVDGDGDLDLLVGNSGLAESDDLSNKLYLNDGGGHFSLKKFSALVDSPSPDLDDTRALTLGDVDGDGDLDLVAANAGQTNKLYLNDGDANFAVVGVAIGSEIDTSTSLVLLDVNDDDALDLIVGNTDEITGAGKRNRLYTNDGNGGFSSSDEVGQPFLGRSDLDATYALAYGDVDNDGDVDLVAANKNQVNKLYLNRGAGKFDASGTAIGEELDDSSSVMLVDMDSDGDLDLVVGNENQTNKLYLNEGSGQFSSVGTVLDDEADTSKAVSLGDVDGDGDMDLLVVNQGQDHKLYRNGSGGGFIGLGAEFGSANGIGGPVNSVAVDDLNNDGFKDVVVGLYNQGNKVYLNDGSGGFSVTGVEIGFDPPADATYDIVLADLNDDGFLDVVVGNYEQQNKAFLNDGDGHFSTLGVVIGVDDEDALYSQEDKRSVYSATYSVALADVDGENGPDIVFGNNNQFNKLYLNNGGGEFPAVGIDVGADKGFTSSVVLADVNGDAKPDLITANIGQTNKIYLNNGAGGFDDGVVIGDQLDLEKDGSVNLAVADLDGVNGPDIVVGNDEWQPNKLYLNDGSGGFTSAGIPVGSLDDGNGDLDLADVDGDGDVDLLVANKNGFNKLYLNDGSAVFSAAMTVGQEKDESRFIKLVNLDEDGSPEVLVGNYGQSSKHYHQVLYRGHVGRVVSKQINPVGLAVRTASVTANFDSPNHSLNDVGSRNTGVDFYLSNNGGLKWHRVKYGKEFFFPVLGDDLRWKAELKSLSPVRTPVLIDVVVKRVNTLPGFTTTPSIKGLFAVGKELELVNFAATDPEDGDVVVVSYQWQSNGKEIPEATTSKYVLAEDNVNADITVRVSVKDSEDGEQAVITKAVNKTSFDVSGSGENSDADTGADDSADVEEETTSTVAKRTGGGSLNLLPLFGLALLFIWRLLAGRRSKLVAAPVLCGQF